MSTTTTRLTVTHRRKSFARWVSAAALSATVGLSIFNAQSSAAQVAHTRAPAAAPAVQQSAVPTIANPRVDKWVARFTGALKGEITAALSRGRVYTNMISQKLAARHMPHELVYLAMIESDFKSDARSHASAVGLWQFMAGTARHFGLNVGRGADDRTNPSRETDAALTYLGQLHDHFRSWYLAAAAYNAGPGAVSRALRRVTGQATGSDADFYRIASALPAETRDYVPKWIAAARVAQLQPNG